MSNLQTFDQHSLQTPSVDYFCIQCRKMLQDSVRIIAKLDTQANNHINLCPSCLAKYPESHIKQYKICSKMSEVVESLNNLPMEKALRCISKVQKNGIQNVELMKDDQEEENELKQVYIQLNKRIFQPIEIGFLEQKPLYTADEYKPIIKEKNSLNRKHLKALGYNWERQQFDTQPESVFGILLSTLAKDQYLEDQYEKLSSILYREYTKEQEKMGEIKDYLVNTMFLLGKKGFNKAEGMPKLLSEMRSKEEEVKELIPKICNLINDIEKESSNEEREKVKGQEKLKDRSKREQGESQRMVQQDLVSERSRTRDKINKKHATSQKQRAKQDKQEKRHKYKEKLPVQMSKPENEEVQQCIQANLQQIKQNQAKDIQAKPVIAKRGRGRPKRSAQKTIIQEEKFIQEDEDSLKKSSKEKNSKKGKGRPKSNANADFDSS